MKKFIILFFCTFLQPLHGELQEQIEQLHGSLVELKNKLSSLQSGLDRLSIKLSGKKAEKEEAVDDEQVQQLKVIFTEKLKSESMFGRQLIFTLQSEYENIQKILSQNSKEKLFDTVFTFFTSNNFTNYLRLANDETYKISWQEIENFIATIIIFFMDSLDSESIKNDQKKIEELQSAITKHLKQDYIKQESKDLLTALQTKIDGDLFLRTMRIVQKARNDSENQFNGLSYFYETLLEAYPHYGVTFIEADSYFQTKIINNIEKILTAIHLDVDAKKNLAVDAFFVVVLICFQEDNCSDIQTKENINKILTALEQDTATDTEQAKFKVNWYRNLHKILSKITGPASHTPDFIKLTQEKTADFLRQLYIDYTTSLKSMIRPENNGYEFVNHFYNSITNSDPSHWDPERSKKINPIWDEFINNKKKLSSIEDAKNFLFLTTSSCFPLDFFQDLLNKPISYIKDLILMVENDRPNAATTQNEALLKSALYTVLQDFLSLKDETHFEYPKIEDAIDAAELETLKESLTSFHSIDKKEDSVKKWAEENQKITALLQKNISEELFNLIIEFITKNDISYLQYFGKEPGASITTALENFLILALISNTAFAQKVFETLLRIIAQTSEITKKEELNQAKHRLFFILSLLFKTGYQEEWAIRLGLELFSRNSSFDKYTLLESLMKANIDQAIFFEFLEKIANTKIDHDLTLSIPGHGEKCFKNNLLNDRYSHDRLFKVYEKFIRKFLFISSQNKKALFEQKITDLDYESQGKEAESSVKKEKEAEVPDEKSEAKTEALDEKILENIEKKSKEQKVLIISKVLKSEEAHEHIKRLIANQKFLELAAIEVNANNTLKDLISKTIELVKTRKFGLNEFKSINPPKILKIKHEGLEVNLMELLIAGIAGKESDKQEASAIFAIIKNSGVLPARKAMAAWFEEWKRE